MKSPLTPCLQWTRGRFLGLVAVLFILQAGLLFLFGEYSGPRPRLSGRAVGFRALDASVDEDQLLRLFFVGDPAVFPLLNARGFSGHGWLDQRPPAYQPENQLEPPVWLNLQTNRLGTNFPGPAPGSEPIALGLVEQPTRREEPWPVFLTPEVMPTQSIFRLEGSLGGRLLAVPALQSWSSAQLLKNTTVQIAVSSAGEVLAARLEAGCGRAETDAEAVAKARALHFRPSRAAGTQWGEAVFQWQTTEPAAAVPLK